MKRILHLMAILVVLSSCVRPSSSETFIKAADAHGGMYTFELDLSDSLVRYDVSFFTRIDGLSSAFQLPLQVVWESPYKDIYDEMVYMPVPKSGEALELYRSAIEPSVYGTWKVYVHPGETPEGFCGLGIVCERKKKE